MRAARATSRLSLRELAALVGTSHATLSAYEQGRKIPSAITFFARDRGLQLRCGIRTNATHPPRIRHADGIARGDELVDVLILAEQFPSRPSATLDLPVFPNP